MEFIIFMGIIVALIIVYIIGYEKGYSDAEEYELTFSEPLPKTETK